MDPRMAYPSKNIFPSDFYTPEPEKRSMSSTKTYSESNADIATLEEEMRKLDQMRGAQSLPSKLSPGFMQGDYFIRNKDGAVLASLKKYGEHFHIEFFAAINNEQYITVWLSRDQAEGEIRRVCKALHLAS